MPTQWPEDENGELPAGITRVGKYPDGPSVYRYGDVAVFDDAVDPSELMTRRWTALDYAVAALPPDTRDEGGRFGRNLVCVATHPDLAERIAYLHNQSLAQEGVPDAGDDH